MNERMNYSDKIHTNNVKLTNREWWHRVLGHVNFKYSDQMVKNKLLYGIPEKLEITMHDMY